MSRTVLMLHALAPPKPAVGAACNGCGVCCAMELCPLAMVLHGKQQGPCPRLQWSDAEQRYFCGLLADARESTSLWRAVRQAWVRRWIGAGTGCDCTLVADPVASSPSPSTHPTHDCPPDDATH